MSLFRTNLWEVDIFFGNDTFDWLLVIADTAGNEFVVQQPAKRLQLSDRMPDQQRLVGIALDIKDAISQIVGYKLEFMTAKFWLDLPQFGCQMHKDSADIFVSYQVYIHTIGDPDIPCHGAEFFHSGDPYEIALRPNHGYINLNIDEKDHRVFAGHGIRQSINFQFLRV